MHQKTKIAFYAVFLFTLFSTLVSIVGALIKKYISKPLTPDPLGSKRFIVPQNDNTGGSGADFIVSWASDKPTNPPIIESVMIGTQSQLGISFTSRGQPLH